MFVRTGRNERSPIRALTHRKDVGQLFSKGVHVEMKEARLGH